VFKDAVQGHSERERLDGRHDRAERTIGSIRRQLGALVGLAPSPYQSGETHHEQGITRAGNKHVRRIMVQLAWRWLYYQPIARCRSGITIALLAMAHACGASGLSRWRANS
jgi:hypothetical protein